ncbi:MAG TPA: divergent polysaccharide deacetylase family protein [Turneriella sp.]|nr:divergent polysaccharide deacetylase family protein [Turneriella sp.]
MIIRNKTLPLLVFVALTLSPQNAKMPYQSTLPEALANTTPALEEIWGEDSCETVIVKKKGYPFVSIACRGNYTKAMRTRFVDTLLKNFFTIKRETYKLKPQNGLYLYKTQYGNEIVYIKLFVREAFDLWPKTPVDGKQIALYIQNVRESRDLVKWRTLGVPLTFGVTVGRGNSRDLIGQISSYGDEVWLAVPLEDETIDVADGRLLTITEALDESKIGEYFNELALETSVTGISPLYCSRFCNNIPALRALFGAVQALNESQKLVVLDTMPTPNASPFYQTARIMNFRAFRAHPFLSGEPQACTHLQNFAAEGGENATRIIAIDAGDENAYNCLSRIAQTNTRTVDFVKISALSLTNRFR